MAIPNEVVTRRTFFSFPNKVSYNICIYKFWIENVGVIWQNIKLHLFPGWRFYVLLTRLCEWASILDWSPARAESSHSQICFSIITALHLLSRVLSTAGNDLYSAMWYFGRTAQVLKITSDQVLYPLGTFVPVPKNLGVRTLMAS